MPEAFSTDQLAPASRSSVGKRKSSLALRKAQACGRVLLKTVRPVSILVLNTFCKHKFSMVYSSFRESHANKPLYGLGSLWFLKVLFMKINPEQLKYNFILA